MINNFPIVWLVMWPFALHGWICNKIKGRKHVDGCELFPKLLWHYSDGTIDEPFTLGEKVSLIMVAAIWFGLPIVLLIVLGE